MSYILDALRRAEAERERGGVPGLHTQTLPEPGEDDVSPLRARGLRPWHGLVIGLAGGLVVAIAWMALRDEAPPPSLAPPPRPPAPAASIPAALPPPPRPRPDEAPEATSPVAIAPMRAAPPPAAHTPAQAASTAAAPATAPGSSVTPIRSLAELPPELRAGLPALAFGGSIYSPAAANRLLIVNGQLMHEGEALAAGVTLEQIKPKAAVLNIRGRRFEVGL